MVTDAERATERSDDSAHDRALSAAYEQALYYARDLSAAYHAERARTRELAQAWESTMMALVTLIDLRDTVTERHSQRVTEYTMRLARRCRISDEALDVIWRGALLHDIGKI